MNWETRYDHLSIDDIIPLYVASVTYELNPSERADLHTAMCNKLGFDRLKFKPLDDENLYSKTTDADGVNSFRMKLSAKALEVHIRNKIREFAAGTYKQGSRRL